MPNEITIQELINKLKTKDLKKKVKYAIIGEDGTVVCLHLSGQNIDLTKILKLFK